MKLFVKLTLGTLVAIVGNWVATWTELKAAFVLGNMKVVVALFIIAFSYIGIEMLDRNKYFLGLWPWHLFWYKRDISRQSIFTKWENEFATLDHSIGKKTNMLNVEVMVGGKRHDIVVALRNLITIDKNARVLVLGEPGSGKTTGLEKLTIELAKNTSIAPILIKLHFYPDYQRGELISIIQKSIRLYTKGYSTEFFVGIIPQLLNKNKRVALLFDGLDEAFLRTRESILADIQQFLISPQYEGVPVVLSSRTRDDPSDLFLELPIYVIQDLSDQSVEKIIEIYKDPKHKTEEIKERLLEYKLLDQKGLGRNPFWLKQIVVNDVFQKNDFSIILKVIDGLLIREWAKPNSLRSWKRVLPREEQLVKTRDGLSFLAYRMSILGQVVIKNDQALSVLSSWKQKHTAIHELRPQDIIALGIDAQILSYESNPIRFKHKLLQDYLTIFAVLENNILITDELQAILFENADWFFEPLLKLLHDPQYQSKVLRVLTPLYKFVGTRGYEQVLSLLQEQNNGN